MQQSYTKNYVKIYLWQVLSVILAFASMFVVVPYLSKEPIIYGIYTICISSQIFLSYADFGFVGAGQKYAAEHFARAEYQEEVRTVGFTTFLLFIFTLLCSVVFIGFSHSPQLVVSDIVDKSVEYNVASDLFLILAIFSVIIVLQRIIQMIYSIRVEDYIFQKFTIIGNIIKIISVLWFFREGHYEIVSYFLFMQIVNVAVNIAGLIKARYRYHYDFGLLWQSFCFNRHVYNKTKALAFSTLLMTFSWIVYYELDSIAIGKIFGAEQVAIYAIGFTILTFFRSIFGILFAPFLSRFNHFRGLNDEVGLKKFFLTILQLTFPLTVFPVLIVVMMMSPIILSWVGLGYQTSIPVAVWLVLCNTFAFVAYPLGILLIAQERIKVMSVIGVVVPLIYWSVILLTWDNYGVLSFGFSKFLVFLVMALVYISIALSYLNISILYFTRKIVLPHIPSMIVVVGVAYFCKDFFAGGKSKMLLLEVSMFCVILMGVAFALSLCFCSLMKEYAKKIVNRSI